MEVSRADAGGRVFVGAPLIQEFDVLADKLPETSSGEPDAKALLFTFATANDKPNYYPMHNPLTRLISLSGILN
jgi:hypothetical protein